MQRSELITDSIRVPPDGELSANIIGNK